MSKNKQPMSLNIDVPDDYLHVKQLAEDDVNFIVKKDTTYGGSWRKRGGIGAAMMLARKWDRLENFLANHTTKYDIFDLITSAEDPEDILDDLKDLRCYLLLVESYIRKQLEEKEEEENAPVLNKDNRLVINKPPSSTMGQGVFGDGRPEHQNYDPMKRQD